MLALIDNYTKVEPTRPFVASHWYKTEFEPIYSSIIVTRNQQHGLNIRIHKLLNEFSLLEDNWDEGGATAPLEGVINYARFIAKLLEKRGQAIFHAAPGPNGEIMLALRNNSDTKSFEIILYPNRSVVVAFPESEEPFQKNFDVKELPNLLEWLNKK